MRVKYQIPGHTFIPDIEEKNVFEEGHPRTIFSSSKVLI